MNRPSVRAAASAILVSGAFFVSPQLSAGATASSHPTDQSRCVLAHALPTRTAGDPNVPAGVSVVTDQGDAAGRDRTCIETSLALTAKGGELPGIGKTGTLTLTIVTDPAEGTGRAGVSVALPPGITAGTPPKGFKVVAVGDPLNPATADRRVKGDGAHPTAIWGFVSLSGGKTLRVSFPVTISAAGAGTIESNVGDVNGALATPATEVVNPGAMASLPLTYSAAGTSRKFEFPAVLGVKPASGSLLTSYSVGWPKSPGGGGTCPGGDVGRNSDGFCLSPTSLIPAGDNPTSAQPIRRQGVRAHAAGTTCISGWFIYTDNLGSPKPVRGLPFKVIDVNTAVDDTIGSGITDSGGNFKACFNNDETGWTQTGTADVKLQFKTDTTQFDVVDRSPLDTGWTPYAYKFETARWDDIPSGNVNWGGIQGSDPDYNRLLHAFDIGYSAWAFANSHSPGAGGCWDAGDCKQKEIMWGPTAREWPARTTRCASRLTGAYLCLPDNGPDWPVVALHELGHGVMYDLYPDGRPAHECPSPHYGPVNEESGCAWSEGFANWFADAVMGGPYLGGYAGENSPSDLTPLPWQPPRTNENDGWGSYINFSRGSNVEDRIASALWDLGDSNNEGRWDRQSLGVQTVWDAFQQQPDNFDFMVNALANVGVDTSSSDFLATLYGNTIDLASSPFREPIGSNSSIDRPLPPSSPPALSIINPANLSSALPEDTSNGHSYVWDRGLLQCTDSVELQNVGYWPNGYIGAGVVPDPKDPAKSYFDYNWVNLTAFSDAAMTKSFATVTTGTKSLYKKGWRVLKMPMSNPVTYLYVLGSAVNGPKDGQSDAALANAYRIKTNKCSTWKLGNGPLTLGPTTERFAGVQLTAGTTYKFTLAPASGALSPDRKRLAVAMVLAQGMSCDAVSDPAGGGAAGSDCNWDNTVASVSGAAKPGSPVTLTYKPTFSGAYQLDFQALNGPGSLVASAKVG